MDLMEILFTAAIILLIVGLICILVIYFEEDTHEIIKFKVRDLREGNYSITNNLHLVIDKYKPNCCIKLNNLEVWTYLDGWIIYNKDIFKDFERFHYLNKKRISNNHFNTIQSYKRQLN